MRGVIGLFRELDSTCDAITLLKKSKLGEFTVYTPTPRHEIEHAIDAGPSAVRMFTLVGGLAGVTFGYWIAIWISDYWPIVVGGKARLCGLWVDDEAVATYVAEHDDRLIGYMSVDPTQPGWQEEMRHGHLDLGLAGIKLMPMYAGFDPADASFDPLYAYAQEKGLPLLVHTGTTFVSAAPLKWALPIHLDEVASRFPGLRMVLAHLGHPFEGECIAVIRKHEHVYADVSALHYRPF